MRKTQKLAISNIWFLSHGKGKAEALLFKIELVICNILFL